MRVIEVLVMEHKIDSVKVQVGLMDKGSRASVRGKERDLFECLGTDLYYGGVRAVSYSKYCNEIR